MQTFDRYFTESEERQLFQAIKRVKGVWAERDYCWIRLIRLTGIRLTPFSKLTVGDAKNAIETSYLQIGEFNKNGKPQSIYMIKESIVLLKKLLAIHRKLSFQSERPLFEQPLVISRQHNALSKRAYQIRFSFWLKESGLKAGSIHWLRHTLSKRLIKNNDNPANALLVVQQVLGHSNISTTTIYTKPDKETIQEMMNNAG